METGNNSGEVLAVIMSRLAADGLAGPDEEFFELVLERLAQLGYEAQSADAGAIIFAAVLVEARILAICNTLVMPQRLRHAAADNVCGEFLGRQRQSGRLVGFDLERALKTVSMGDVSVTLADGGSSAEQLDGLITALTQAGEGEYACYRKLRW